MSLFIVKYSMFYGLQIIGYTYIYSLHRDDSEDSLRRRLERLHKENAQLKCENLLISLQERYTELRGMFYEAEEELVRFRQQPSPFRTGSIDSLYDSLASELENSDSGFSGTPAMSSRNEGLNLRLELQKMTEKNSGASPSKEEVDVPSTVLAEVARKKIAIEPTAPPQTPQSETVPTPTENLKNEEFTRKITCDASTSTYAENSEIESVTRELNTSDPILIDHPYAPVLHPPLVTHVILPNQLRVLEVEQDYAQFLKRKGLPPSTFFSEEFPVQFYVLLVDWTANFCRIGMGVGLEIVHDVQVQGQGQGVLTRAELGPPSSSPRLLPPAFSNGLVPIISCFSHNSSDIFSRSKGVFLRPGL
uniref:TBD domain-containing protein n=1 Tax=Heterorhabditis bacteriophora TaxID=37862 RepID=A0A1I7WM11_HETBA